jgi:hypothetical protein
MKKILFLFFVLTVSGYTYSQVTSFNLPISRVLLFDMNNHFRLNNALTVPVGKLWFIQQVNYSTYWRGQLGDVIDSFGANAVFPEGTKLYNTDSNSLNTINIIEYDLDAQNISLDTNDTKLDNKMQLFPNPTNSRLSLNSEKDYKIEVFDLKGVKIMETQGNNLDMSMLSNATYIVKVLDKETKESDSYKVVKN